MGSPGTSPPRRSNPTGARYVGSDPPRLDVPNASPSPSADSPGPASSTPERGLPPGRWLTTEPPDDIDALRSTSTRGRRRASRRGLGFPLVVATLTIAALTTWQLGWLDLDRWAPEVTQPPAESTTVPPVDPLQRQVREVLTSAGFAYLGVEVAGEQVTLRGNVPDDQALATVANLVLSVSGVAELDNRLEIGPPSATEEVQAAAESALSGDRFAGVTVAVQTGIAVLTGAVSSEEDREAAASAVLAVLGVEKLDNRLAVGTTAPTGPTLPAPQLRAAAAAALAEAGLDGVSVTIEGRRAYLAGVVPLEAAREGYFAYVGAAETAVLSVEGIEQVLSSFSLRGDGALLRDALHDLIEGEPVIFAVGSAELTTEARSVLDRAAQIIQSQPGLQVLIAGHTDTAGSNEANEALSRLRGEAVRAYLLSRGIPSYRLAVVAYGELFPGQDASDAANRRIEFEVGP